MIDSYMFVTGGRPAIRQRRTMPVAWEARPRMAMATPMLRKHAAALRKCAINKTRNASPYSQMAR